eukprot:COSAG05_NODE_1151_length_5713_cov_19.933915_3_plen_86_part_00
MHEGMAIEAIVSVIITPVLHFLPVAPTPLLPVPTTPPHAAENDTTVSHRDAMISVTIAGYSPHPPDWVTWHRPPPHPPPPPQSGS